MIQVPKDAPSLGPSNDRLPRGEWTRNQEAQAVGRKNTAFLRSSPAAKRVTIAKDVIEWLDAKKLIPAGTNGGSEYLRIIPVEGVATELGGGWARPQPREVVEEHGGVVNGDACVACGIGALVATAAERGVCHLNNIHNWIADDVPAEIHSALAGIFEPKQLALIEYAFEQGSGLANALRTGHLRGLLEHDERDQCLRFGSSFLTREERLRAIMTNIIDNKGTFIP